MADHCQAPKAKRISPALVSLVGLAMALILPMPASAVPPDPPAGLAVIVLDIPGPGNDAVFVRFQLSPTDPDQDVGSFDYNLFYDDGVTSGSEALTGGNPNVGILRKGGGYWTASVLIPSALVDPATFNVQADDGVDTSLSCGATIDPDTLGEYDACDSMVLAWQDLACLPTGTDEPGFDWYTRYKTKSDVFHTGAALDNRGKTAAGGIDLAGDAQSIRLDFKTRSFQDGESSLFRFMLSQVPVQASAVTGANYIDRGAFGYGYSLLVEEEGNDYRVKIKYHPGDGQGTVQLFEALAATGVTANEWTAGYVYLDAHTNALGIGIGPNEYVVGLEPDLTAEPDLFSVWVVNYARDQLFGAAVSQHEHERSTFCLSTLPLNQGGTSTIPGFASEFRLEDFSGSGGRVGDPTFPGMDIGQLSEQVGIGETALGWLLAFVLIASSLIAGMLLGGPIAAGAGSTLAMAASVYLGLMPLWLIVLVFLACMVIIVFLRRQ